jgi:hypothetical protein
METRLLTCMCTVGIHEELPTHSHISSIQLGTFEISLKERARATDRSDFLKLRSKYICLASADQGYQLVVNVRE